MHWFSIAVALLVALGIIWIGTGYLANPRGMAPSFGLPLPEEGTNIVWWLRLKGVRDVASGLLVLAFTAWDGHRALGIVLLVEAMIPVGDMSIVLAAKGSASRAFGIHGITTMLMILGSVPLVGGAA